MNKKHKCTVSCNGRESLQCNKNISTCPLNQHISSKVNVFKNTEELDVFRKNQKVMLVKVSNCDTVGAQGPFAIKNIDIFADTITLKEVGIVFDTQGIYEVNHNNNNDTYYFLLPVMDIIRKNGKNK